MVTSSQGPKYVSSSRINRAIRCKIFFGYILGVKSTVGAKFCLFHLWIFQ